MSSTTAWAVYRLPPEETPTPAESGAPPVEQIDKLMALANLRWFCRLRWMVIASLVALGVAGPLYGRWFPGQGLLIGAGWPLAVAAVLALLNGAYLILPRWIAATECRETQVLNSLWLQILVDLAALTVVVHYLGSLESSAAFMYLFHIVLACIFFPYRHSLLVALSAGGMYLACLAVEQAGWAPPRSIWALLAPRSAMPWSVLAWQCASVLFISGTVWYLASRLASALRQREEELAATNRRLVAATEERAQHMLRTTHQLKAPFAAIQANTQVLLGGYCGTLPEAALNVIRQISTRCDMLSKEIKEMLQLANLRSAAQNMPPLVRLDLAGVVQTCLASLRPAAEQRHIVFSEQLEPVWIQAVQDHTVMLVENIVTNAVNYSRDGGEVTVSCGPTPAGSPRLMVRDRGIGIPAEKLPRIFEDYFRTNEAVKHNKASTGLGLAIVRQAALAGNIGVQVESAVGEGTLFTLDFPPTDAS